MKGLAETFEGRGGIGPSAPVAAGVIAAVTIGLTVAWVVAQKPRQSIVASAPTGAPCPVVARAAVASHPGPALQSAVGGVVFARQAGDVVCDVEGDLTQEVLGAGDDVSCEFSAPGRLSVRTRQAEFDFAAPTGQVATVIVSHGQPRCVLASPHWTAVSRSLADDMHARAS
jgi:hypothetical protein